MSTKTNLILIGNELLDGLILDKNGTWLSQFLHKKGLKLERIETVRDELTSIVRAIQIGFEESDIIILSGGMGPTDDDLTKYAMAKFAKQEVVKRDDAFQIVKSHYDRIEKEFDPLKNHYDHMPERMEILSNSAGLAPGLFFKENGKSLVALPGVPREFSTMIKDHVEKIYPNLQNEQIEKFLIRTFRIPEEKIFKDLEPTLWDRLSKFGKVSSLPHVLGVDIGVDLPPCNIEEKEKLKSEIRHLMERTVIKENIWNYGAESLEELIVKEARNKNLTIGLGESCTGGLTAHSFTDIAGCSDVFMGSAVTYSNQAKVNILNVSEKTLKIHGAVSEETALEMAIGVREALACDIALTFTGIAGPGGGSKEKPVGTVGIGLSYQDKSSSNIYYFKGDRKMLKERFMKQGLFNLLKVIRTI